MIKKCPVCNRLFKTKNAKKFCSNRCRIKKQSKIPKKKRKETLCWTCQNAVCGCSWSKHFEPVEGWKAKPTKVRGNLELDEWIDSWLVVRCPEYIED